MADDKNTGQGALPENPETGPGNQQEPGVNDQAQAENPGLPDLGAGNGRKNLLAVETPSGSRGRRNQEKQIVAKQPEFPSVNIVVERPIYHTPGYAPYVPGDLLTVCVVTARELIGQAYARLAEGETLPPEPAIQAGDGYAVFPKRQPPVLPPGAVP